MTIITSVDIITNALWPQGDARDPLGVWGARLGVTGDATGSSILVRVNVPAAISGRFVFTLYDFVIAQLTGTITATSGKIRLLTNWPNIDPIPQVQGFGSFRVFAFSGSSNFQAPIAGIANEQPYSSPQRFLLLFDPRSSVGAITIAELELAVNTDLATYSFEAYGYYWDRGVLNAPGGPRHPGSS